MGASRNHEIRRKSRQENSTEVSTISDSRTCAVQRIAWVCENGLLGLHGQGQGRDGPVPRDKKRQLPLAGRARQECAPQKDTAWDRVTGCARAGHRESPCKDAHRGLARQQPAPSSRSRTPFLPCQSPLSWTASKPLRDTAHACVDRSPFSTRPRTPLAEQAAGAVNLPG